MIIWLSHDWMLCSSEGGYTVQVIVGDANKEFIVETEWVASKGMRQHLLGQACCQMKNKHSNRKRTLLYAALRLRWVAQHALLTCKRRRRRAKEWQGWVKTLWLPNKPWWEQVIKDVPSTLNQPTPTSSVSTKQEGNALLMKLVATLNFQIFSDLFNL